MKIDFKDCIKQIEESKNNEIRVRILRIDTAYDNRTDREVIRKIEIDYIKPPFSGSTFYLNFFHQESLETALKTFIAYL